MSDTKLKPCPFCESDPTVVMGSIKRQYLPDLSAYWIECNHCGARGPWYEDISSAMICWNCRPIEEELNAD